MCGICGAISLGSAPAAPLDGTALRAMLDALRHRGPDDTGEYVGERAVLGATRLSVIDVADGHQPFANENGSVWAVQNGEIYNHDELRSRLSGGGHRFRSRCDTEVIPHLYEEHGAGLTEHLRGMFAIAVSDESRDRVVLARDRLGIKPLYYAERSGRLLFASELKSLLASGYVEPDLDPEAVEVYLTLGLVPAPYTLLRDIRKLPPGHRLVVDAGRVQIERYWSYPRVAGPDKKAREGEWVETLRDGLRDAVRMRLMSDVPLGAMLSGGLDSSLIVALMAAESATPVQTFAVGVAGSTSNELPDARRVAAALGTDHHELELGDQAPDIDELSWYLDEPLADLSALGFLSLSALARRHVTVALSGQGADELFAGYRHHLHARYAQLGQAVPRPIRGPLLKMGGRGPHRARRLAEVVGARNAIERALVAKRISSDGELEALLGSANSTRGARDVIAALAPGEPSDPLAASLAIDAQLSLPDDMLQYFDRASMAHSLEVRVPFLDHHFVELCASIPSNLKLSGKTTKHILREAARGLVPDFVLEKRKVGFFNAEITTWIDRLLARDGLDLLLPEQPRYAPLIDRAGVETILKQQGFAPTARRAQLLFAIVLLEAWLRSTVPLASARSGGPTARSTTVVAA